MCPLLAHVNWSLFVLYVCVCGADINGAAQQGASLQSFVDDPVKVSGGAAELVHLRHTARKVLEPLCGASSRQGLVGSIQPGTMEKKTLCTYASSRRT